MSIASEINRINTNISAAYDAAEAKGATMPATENSANLPTAIRSIPEAVQPILITKQITENGTYTAEDDNADGYSEVTVNVPVPAPVEEKDVNFYDYDGTVLFAYTKDEIFSILALPENSGVTHDLLSFQSWNWSLSDIKTWLQKYPHSHLNVGAIYTTIDGLDHNEWKNPRLITSDRIFRQKRGTASLEQNAFRSCFSLEQINIPSGAITIGSYAFSFCYPLKAINVPNGVTSIGENAFERCGLKEISLPNGVTSIENNAFANCTMLEKIAIPDSVTNMHTRTFSGCTHLKEIGIPEKVTIIGERAFYDCCALERVYISAGVITIDQYAFYDNFNIPQIEIPSSVTNIRSNAFYKCVSLNDVVIKGNPTLEDINGFANGPTTRRFYVPRENLSWFETATNWSNYYSKMYAIEDYIEYLESIGINVDEYKEITS